MLLTALRQAGASDFKKKKAAEAALSPQSAAALSLQASGSPGSISSKKLKRERTGALQYSRTS